MTDSSSNNRRGSHIEEMRLIYCEQSHTVQEVNTLRIAIYSRKSVYTGKGDSIENQIEMCKQYIASKLSGITEQDISIYEDEGFSAKNTDRPQFQKLLKEIKLKRIDTVVCYRLDRISRNVSDFAALIEELNQLNVSFICIKEEFDTSKPMGKAMMFIASVFAQLERETLAERVRDNMFMLARTGRWLGGTAPTGFVSETIEKIDIDGKTKSTCKLKFDPVEIEIVKILFQKFMELQSISAVSKYLIEANLRSRTGKWYSLLGIKQILENPVYCIADSDARAYFIAQDSDVCFKEEDCSDRLGLLSYNKRDHKKKHAPRQAKSEWIIAIGKHEGIISGKQWVSIQTILEANKPTARQQTENPVAKMHNGYSLLSGMIFCRKCGSKMFANTRKGKCNKQLFDYVCKTKLLGGKKLCDSKNLNGQQTDELVCNYLTDFTYESLQTHMLLHKLKKSLQSQEQANPLAELELKIHKCNCEMENLIRTLTQPNLVQALIQAVNAKVSTLSAELDKLNSEKERLLNAINPPSDRELQLDQFSNTLSSLKSCLKDLTIQEKRTLVKLFIQKLEWDGSDLHLFTYAES